MEGKKKLPLSAVWNQLDSVYVREPSYFGALVPSISDRSSDKEDDIRFQRISTLNSQPLNLPSRRTVDNQNLSSRTRNPVPNVKKSNEHRNYPSQEHKSDSSVASFDCTKNRGRVQSHAAQSKTGKTQFRGRNKESLQGKVAHDRRQYHDNRNYRNQKVETEHHFSSDRYSDAKPISFTRLNELITKPSSEILLSINRKNCGFMVLIKQSSIKPDMMALALISLGKACSAPLNQGVSSLLNIICSNTNFLLTSIQKYLVSFRQNCMKDFHLESLSYLTVFLQKFQLTLPSSSSETISILLPLLQSTCENFLCSHFLYNSVIIRLKEIKEENDRYINEYSPSDIAKASKKEALQMCEPPASFRSLPVLPNVDDLHSNAFLRPNIVEGKYANTEHYLDVQYRLLREDYVKPLRDGIADYLMLKKNGKPVKNCRSVKVYENVHIVKQDFVNGGIVHIVQFNVKNFAKIKWEYSKRFLSGSLLCLSSDDFKTMLFASVAQRIPEQLKKGKLLIRFEDISDEVLNLTPLTTFVIIETTAYFEAYRYNLRALLELSEDILPLKRYIIDVEKTVNCPQYLKPSSAFDMRPLLLPLDSIYIKRITNTEGDISINYEFPADVSNVCRSVRILNDSEWPSASTLGLDPSQYHALKAAITREFAIIQGPPGTGKTYIGLRIVQLLLHNIDKWFSKPENSLPILVVCYTNHALDQFLEGLMRFTNKIVRIGGRGTNEAVSKYQLSNLKRNAVAKKEVPGYISSSMWHKNHELRCLKKEIDQINYSVEKSLKVVLGEWELSTVIPDFQFKSLKDFLKHPSLRDYNLPDDGFLIHDWLYIRSRAGWNDPGMFDMKSVNIQKRNINFSDLEVNEDADDDEEGEVESIGEADIEFLEAQRDIDSEEFADVSFEIEVPEMEEFVLPQDSGWQVQGGRKRQLQHIKKCLSDYQPLEEEHAMEIKNVWRLDVPTRWQLYKFWIQKLGETKQKECMAKQLMLKQQYKEVCEMRTEEDIFVMQKAHIVGMTTTGAAKYRNIVLRLNPQILIVEEAAEILESHIVTSLAPKTQHVILIGDHQQLRPSPTVYMLAVNYDLNISLFERMIKNQMECFRLLIQHRMRPDVTDLIVPHIYSDLKNHESVFEYENIKGVSKNVFFVTHNFTELQENDSKSKINEHEAKFLIKLCKYFVLQGYDSSKITVLTTYSGQLFVMKRLITDTIRKVRFTVVDNFQGEENDIILISFVRSNEEGEIGFLKVANRVCVALSRAKAGLFCIGNFELLAEKSCLWKDIVSTLQKKQSIGPSLQLVCQNHPEIVNIVANEKDFETVPEGGCTKVCEYRLMCGHVCSLMCHPYDMAHENVRCHKSCTKTCTYGHKCQKKCFEACGKCVQMIDKTVFPCGHTIKIHCYMQKEVIKCTARCDKILSCGHKCPNICSKACTEICSELITVKSPICGHNVTVQCCYKNRSEELMKRCRNHCNVVLDCGHTCKGNCYRCHQGRLHIACNQPCKRILVCGHECKAPCAKSCPPCKTACENRCTHSKCPKKCGEPCQVCTEPCGWHCKHLKCTRPCGSMCNRVPCNEPCPKLLECGHSCIGFCGEPCPTECKLCNSEVVKEIFFGTEDDDNARFVCLEDCNHILEISGLNEWIKTDDRGEHQIQMKVCPKCKTVIRTNLRFGNIVKGCLRQIENVKKITFGSVDENKKKQSDLLAYLKENAVSLERLNSGSLYKCWERILSSKNCRSYQEITTMENIIRLSLQLADVVFYLSSCITYIDQVSSVRESLEVLSMFMNFSKNWLIDFVQDDFLTASDQQLHQLTWEIHRLCLGMKVMKLVKKYAVQSYNEFEKCVSILVKYAPFGDNDVKAFGPAYKSLAEKCGSAVIDLSELEKQSILKAMNLSIGHWYQCPKGHVYCITECGGATEVGRCNECNAQIGGTGHTLLGSNRVASDMDGATHSAWSEFMNMANFRNRQW